MIGIMGASGFIGRTLADALAARGAPYAALVRQVPDAKGFPGDVTVRQMDLATDPAKVLGGVDTLILAGWASKPNTPGNTYETEIAGNVLPHIRLLEALRATDVAHLIFLSSGGAVYGNLGTDGAITEDRMPVPCIPYGYGKLMVEKAIEAIWAPSGRRFTILRPSNPVGPHQMMSAGVHGLFPSVIAAIAAGRMVQVYGDGSTVRDYFAADDLADLIVRAADQDRGNHTLNAASGTGLSINEVIAMCEAATGRRAEVAYHKDKMPVIAHNVLCNAQARDVFGWSPQRDIAGVAHQLAEAAHA